MKALGKKAAIAAVTMASAGAIAVAPTVQPPPAPAPEIRLTAQVHPLAAFSVTDWLGRIVIPPSLSAALPNPPQPPPPSVDLQNIDSTVKSIYFAVEPWVHYGFQIAQYVVGWIPFVGWLAPQIDIFYHLGERIVRSAIFNTTELLTGQGSFFENLGQFGVDTINSFVYFANDQLAFWLPPIPPLPPIFGQGVINEANTFAVQNDSEVSRGVPAVDNRLIAPVDAVDLDLPGALAGTAATKLNIKPLNIQPRRGLGTIKPSADPPNTSKIDPFRIVTGALTSSGETPTKLRDAVRGLASVGATNPVAGISSPFAGKTNPSAGISNSLARRRNPSGELNKVRIPGFDNGRLTSGLGDGTPDPGSGTK